MIAVLKKRLRRMVRYNGAIERAQQIVRKDASLFLAPISLRLEIKPGDIIIDCGANVGDMTSAFARTGAQVYAFEPNPNCFAILESRFSKSVDVKCFNQGVMNCECTLTLSVRKANGRWDAIEATVSGSFNQIDDGLEVEPFDVRCISLSEFIFSLNKPVKLLKIDIEGSEIEVINDLIDTKAIDRVELAVVETHEKHQPELLEKTNELRTRILSEGLSPKIRLDWI